MLLKKRMTTNIFKLHPWHGVDLGNEAPELVTAFIEIIPSDTVKYEIDKHSGYLKWIGHRNLAILSQHYTDFCHRPTVQKM